MNLKRNLKRVFIAVLVLLLSYAIYYCWISFPVGTAYGAKVLCSSIFVSGRNEQDIRSQELNFTPLTFATYEVNNSDSSVTCSLFGFANRKAIYRKGLGATVVNELSEKQIRAQRFRLAAKATFNTDTIFWPLGDKIQDGFPINIDSVQLAKAVEKLFIESDTVNPNRTRALIVVYDGKIVIERYGGGFTKDMPLTGWSMSKSITSAIIGVLVKQNKLVIDNPAPVPEWKEPDDPRHPITIRQLLQQTSGLEFEEVYSKSSHATRMICQKGDMAAYSASLPLIRPPGSLFHYSSGNTNILSRIIRHTVGNNYHAFPYEQLFHKLGMYSVVFEPDASGTFVGSSFCYATARDWARFGLLYLNNGEFNNEQILPGNWVKESVISSAAAEKGQYGFQWWLNAGEKNNPENRWFPLLPTDMFFADGFEGQNLFIVPSKKLIVVRLGLTRKRQYGEEEFLKAVIQSIR